MSAWSDEPEWFEDWIVKKAEQNYFGQGIKSRMEAGELDPYDLWQLVIDGKVKALDGRRGYEIANDASRDFAERGM